MGVSHALLVHSGTAEASDLFKAVITMLDPHVALSVVPLPLPPANDAAKPLNGNGAAKESVPWIQQDLERAEQLRRELDIQALPTAGTAAKRWSPAEAIVELARQGEYDVVIIGKPSESSPQEGPPLDVEYILDHAPCWVCLVAPTPIPQEVDEGPVAAADPPP